MMLILGKGIYKEFINVVTTVRKESISKELYFREGGTKPDDKDLYFDTDCLALLESKWSLSKKSVMVSSPISIWKEMIIYI